MVENIKKIKEKKGITLISLIIAVVILAILATISINIALGDNGLIKKSQKAGKDYANASEEEIQKAKNASNEIKKLKYNKGQYFIVEVRGILSNLGNCAELMELEFYDENDTKISYNISNNNSYDIITKSYPEYWQDGTWCWMANNLYDGDISYKDNLDGGKNGSVFLWKTTDENRNEDNYARFLVSLDTEKDISNIRICVGDVENRTPSKVSVYKVNKYTVNTYSNNIVKDNNDGLKLIGQKEFKQVITTPTWYNISTNVVNLNM